MFLTYKGTVYRILYIPCLYVFSVCLSHIMFAVVVQCNLVLAIVYLFVVLLLCQVLWLVDGNLGIVYR